MVRGSGVITWLYIYTAYPSGCGCSCRDLLKGFFICLNHRLTLCHLTGPDWGGLTYWGSAWRINCAAQQANVCCCCSYSLQLPLPSLTSFGKLPPEKWGDDCNYTDRCFKQELVRAHGLNFANWPPRVLSWCRSCSSYRRFWGSSARQSGWSSACPGK